MSYRIYLSDIVEVPVGDGLLLVQLPDLIEQHMQLELVLQIGKTTEAERLTASESFRIKSIVFGA